MHKKSTKNAWGQGKATIQAKKKKKAHIKERNKALIVGEKQVVCQLAETEKKAKVDIDVEEAQSKGCYQGVKKGI